MNIISEDKFLSKKNSDTIVILGSGYSINNINSQGWEKINSFDSIGFNWFCHHIFAPTFYIIREQGSNKRRSTNTETISHLYKDLSKKPYKSTCIIFINIKHHSPKSYKINMNNIKQDGIVIRDIKGNLRIKCFTFNIFRKGTFHGKCTLTNAIHISLFLKYKRIVFAGIDLYNSRYFWLPKKNVRYQIARAGLGSRSRHPITYRVMRLTRFVSTKFNHVEFYSINRKSLINKHIACKNLEDL